MRPAITFSRAWEDDRLDLAALAIGPGARVLVVAAAGDAALAFAAAGAERVIAVDRNPAQLHLVALKIATATAFNAETRHRWFEVGREPAAPRMYRRALRGGLDAATAAFWDRNIELFVDGFHDHVGVGRPFARVGRLARLLVPSLAAAIERFETPAEQATFWRERVRGRLFGPLTHWICDHTPVLSPLAPNPHELRRMRRGHYSRALATRIDGIVGRHLVREHPWWRPALSGLSADPGHGAAWLDPGGAVALETGAGRIELVEGDLIDVLETQPAGSLDAVSVSNVPDWLAPGEHLRLRAALVRALTPRGRVLVRSVLAGEHALDGDGLVREARSERLVDDERTALYGAIDLLRPA
jgi:S-adenosylmethionine-diacylglycerol 3-amino-3-carboxypropyl transferase